MEALKPPPAWLLRSTGMFVWNTKQAIASSIGKISR